MPASPSPSISRPPRLAPAAGGRVEVYDASGLRRRLDAMVSDPVIPVEQLASRMNEATFTTPLPLARSTGQSPTGDATVDRAFDNATCVDRFMRESLGRDGWDGRGSPLRVKVHFPSDNANWEYRDDSYWVGERPGAASLGQALDITAHEVAHGIFKSEVFRSAREANRFQPDVWQRAVDEHFADVLASLVDRRNWTMGEDVGDPAIVRDMAHPRIAHMRDVPRDRLVDLTGPSAAHLGAPTDRVGEHDLSGVPSRAAVQVARSVGRDRMGRIWYRALTGFLTKDDRFPEAARATLAAAAELHGAASREHQAVADAWRSVGVVPAAPAAAR